jgi:drug/metabolite transporter (DMT)-like permease
VVLAGAVIGVLGWNAGVQRLGPANAALFMNLVPVVTFGIEAVRGTTPGPVEIVGALVTLSALVGANATLRRPAPEHPPAVRTESMAGVSVGT